MTQKEKLNVPKQYSSQTLINKINIYMRHHVEPWVNPESIRWWFSLSGGKDSFSMVLGIKKWYDERSKKLDAYGFHVSQWAMLPLNNIREQLPWLKFIHVDGCSITQKRIHYKPGDQAPCRKCADVRRELNDELIRSHGINTNKINFLARGLHLTDTVISLLWRRALGFQPVHSLLASGKGQPLIRLWDGTYLVKPIFYAREFETQIYANSNAIRTYCCNCPGYKFPSRRDIVEETIVPLFNEYLWEFSTPDLADFLSSIKNGPTYQDVMSASIPGKESKIERLPPDFSSFAVDYYRRQIIRRKPNSLISNLDYKTNLDSLGLQRLRHNVPLYRVEGLPAPGLLLNNSKISSVQGLLISSLGPFWGMVALSNPDREKALALQEAIFGLKIEENWAHFNKLIKKYYWRKKNDTTNGKELSLFSFSQSNNFICDR